ncbi:MAG: hypothetical protein HUK22_04630, partial [Thermoguttaceae bacterium]|nr:hypothetical protein [Thermoguttaceae bacterium]
DVAVDRARKSITTLSADVPSPSLVFPNAYDGVDSMAGERRDGVFGFQALIRRCVESEILKVFYEKGLMKATETEGPVDLDNGMNAQYFDKIVDDVSRYLTSMLPPEILAGERIDLNKLAQKDYWLDVQYDASGRYIAVSDANGNLDLHNLGLVKRMEYARGLYLVVMALIYDDMNAGGLYYKSDESGVKNEFKDYFEGAFNLDVFKDSEDEAITDETGAQTGTTHYDRERGLMQKELIATRVAQWCVNAVDFADPDATMTPFFFDPTPFDGWWVAPGDGKSWGWLEQTYTAATDPQNPVTFSRWRQNNWVDASEPEVDFLFAPENGVPAEIMSKFFLSLYNSSNDAIQTDPYYRDKYGNAVTKMVKDPTTGADVPGTTLLTDAELVALWLQGKTATNQTKGIGDLGDQSTDLGFRVVWGMESPDLLLTETLNFHDLGIADGKISKKSDSEDGTVRSGNDDEHYDQVKRPVGSTYLELYCAANPNIPQSPELYDYDEASGLWQLRLTKTTPLYTDSQRRSLNMPVWRVAISESTDPLALNEGKKEGNDDFSQARAYYNKWNSVLERLNPDPKGIRGDGKNPEEQKSEFSFFSMQPRQFRNLPLPIGATKRTGDEALKDIAKLDLYQGVTGKNDAKLVSDDNVLSDWLTFADVLSANLLGSAVQKKMFDGKGKDAQVGEFREREIELDRIVWFSGEKDLNSLEALEQYPDAFRTFANVNNTTNNPEYLAPNQYLVIGPEEKRSIGSVPFELSAGKKEEMRYGKAPLDTDKSNWINLRDLNGNGEGNYKYIVAKSLVGKVSDGEDTRRGLNISEPLWMDPEIDPYYFNTSNVKIDPTKDPEKREEGGAIDVPFELPEGWCENEPDNRINGYE